MEALAGDLFGIEPGAVRLLHQARPPSLPSFAPLGAHRRRIGDFARRLGELLFARLGHEISQRLPLPGRQGLGLAHERAGRSKVLFASGSLHSCTGDVDRTQISSEIRAVSVNHEPLERAAVSRCRLSSRHSDL